MTSESEPLDLLTAWTEALLAEREHDRKHLAQIFSESSLKVRRSEGLTWSPVEVTKASYAFGGAKWSVACKEGGGLPGIFRVGSAVLLTPVGDVHDVTEWGKWPARVMKIRGLEMDVVLEGDGPEGMALQHVLWTVDARADERSYNAMAHALSHWVNIQDSERKTFRNSALAVSEWFSLAETGDVVIADASGLNAQQRTAAENVWSRAPLSLLHGPPGTGKTKTLVSAIWGLVRAGDQVLASAPSNMAVDVLVERLGRTGLNVVRLGHPMRVSDHVSECTLDVHIQRQPEYGRVVKTRQEAEQRQREADRYVRNFGSEQREARRAARAEARALRKEATELEAYLSEKVIREADVVCATLVGCDDHRLRGLTFDVAVVDEAAQALPPAVLIAMRRAMRLVLCGDPCQLPPTVKSKEGRILEKTMLERLIEVHPERTVMLEVQHRMHEAIMSAGNAHFYGGRLRAHEEVAHATLEGIRPWIWVDTAGCGFEEMRSAKGGSVSNPEEAAFVLDRAVEWFQKHPGMSLGIVAPYAAQVELLRDLWSEAVLKGDVQGHANVTIQTVDGFQGQERDGMIVSLTRSNDRGEVGFLSESRRIHVAQTRAKQACMLVGDSATLSTNPYLRWLLEHAQERDDYDSAWSWMVG